MKKEIIILLFILPLVFLYVFSHKIDFSKKKPHRYVVIEDSFEILEGQETKDWHYIQTQQDYQDLAYYKELYERNYKHQFNCNLTFKIPTVVHLIWLGPKPFPIDSVNNIRSWIAHHPDWTFKFWTDRHYSPPCNGMEVHLLDDFVFQFLKTQFKESSNWKEKSDMWLYEILYQEGGMCIDHKFSCIKPFHGLHTGYDFYAALNAPHEEIDSLALSVGIEILGAKAQHPIFLAAINNILERWDRKTKKFCTPISSTQVRLGMYRTFIAMTLALKEGLNHPENTDIIFPASYFYAKRSLPGFYTQRPMSTFWDRSHKNFTKRIFYNVLQNIKKQNAKIIHVELLSMFAIIGSAFICYLIKKNNNKQSA